MPEVRLEKHGVFIEFGPYEWRVLDVLTDKMLLLSERTMKPRPYNVKYEHVTWAACTLRRYLNTEFYSQFSAEEKARIAETKISNKSNPWLGTSGGAETIDKIFLLSLEEVVHYFGDSGQLRNKNPKSTYWINDQYNSARIARDANGTASWWWLRSPGLSNRGASYVNVGGSVNVAGHYVNSVNGVVRPALYLLK